MNKGIVFNIQHFSVHDGPGIRTVVFLKGCPLRCKWCANPESQLAYPQMGWTCKECIGCKCCVKELASLDCRFDGDGLKWNDSIKELPNGAGDVCPSGAFHVIGKIMSVEEVLTEVEKDRKFYENSSGGLTLSGGEPMMQADFVTELLAEAKQRHIRTTMETCGCASRDTAVRICGYLDKLIMDIKLLDSEKHIEWTGADNHMILDNIHAIRKAYPSLPILIRTPVIPGVNDNEDELVHIAQIAVDLGADYEILKYHRLGISKYESLNREYPMGDVELPQERFEHLKAVVQSVLS